MPLDQTIYTAGCTSTTPCSMWAQETIACLAYILQFATLKSLARHIVTRKQPVEMEPLCDTSAAGRFVLFPIKHADIWEMYKVAEACFWTAEEVDLGKDEFTALKPGERTFVKHVLAFFAAADGIVNENLALNFYSEVAYPEARAFYATQIFIETIHSEVYSQLIQAYVSDAAERAKLFAGIEEFPAVARKARWALKYTSRASAPFAARLAAFACVEGIFFSGAFASIFYLRKQGKLPGLGQANQLISRDEGLHCKFAAMLYKNHVRNKPDPNLVLDMVQEAVSIEKEFWSDALDIALIGLNKVTMGEYIEYVADYILNLLGLPKFYNSANPYEWMDSFSMENKTNFFENKVSEYAKAYVSRGQVKPITCFDTSCEF